jgi:hypothetical protein
VQELQKLIEDAFERRQEFTPQKADPSCARR